MSRAGKKYLNTGDLPKSDGNSENSAETPDIDSAYSLLSSARLCGWLVFTAVCFFYGLGTSLVLPPGFDSGELVSACASGGIAHPPGYPLYTMLGWLLCGAFSFADPACVMNFFSAFCGAAAAGILCFALIMAAKSVWCGIGGALCFAAAASPWRMAAGAEVFSLHLMFCAVLAAAAEMWKIFPGRRRFWLGAAALCLGLALSHHQTILLFVPGMAVFMFLERKNGEWGVFWELPLVFAAGLLPYLWLPLRSSYLLEQPAGGTSAFCWGSPDTWERFWWVVSRRGYGSLQLSTAACTFDDRMASLGGWAASLALDQTAVIGCLLLLAGLAVCIRTRELRGELALWGVFLLLSGPFWAVYAAQPASQGAAEMMERFYASSYMAAAAFIAFGISFGEYVTNMRRFSVVSALLVPVILICLGWNCIPQRNLTAFAFCGSFMSEQVPDDALVIVQSDAVCGSFMYAKSVKGRRFTLVPAGLAASEWFINSLPEHERQALASGGLKGLAALAASSGRPIYFDDDRTAAACIFDTPGLPGAAAGDGMLFRYVRPDEGIFDSEQSLKDYHRVQLARLEKLKSGLGKADFADIENKRLPFWHRFMLSRLRYALGVNSGSLHSPLEELSLRSLETAGRR